MNSISGMDFLPLDLVSCFFFYFLTHSIEQKFIHKSQWWLNKNLPTELSNKHDKLTKLILKLINHWTTATVLSYSNYYCNTGFFILNLIVQTLLNPLHYTVINITDNDGLAVVLTVETINDTTIGLPTK